MRTDLRLRASDGVVARRIESETILVPLMAGIGDLGDELYTFNETGAAIWGKLDGTRTLEEIARELATEYDAALPQIRDDVLGLAQELTCRGILEEASPPCEQ